jgi:hypothetical protein
MVHYVFNPLELRSPLHAPLKLLEVALPFFNTDDTDFIPTQANAQGTRLGDGVN